MKFLFIDTYYPQFLKSFYRKHPGTGESYRQLRDALLQECFGTSDYYSFHLKQLGHQVEDVIVNDKRLQALWVKEHGVAVNWQPVKSVLQSLPLMYRYFGQPQWIQSIALAQIQQYRPDVLYVHNLSILDPDTLKEARQYVKIIVGQIACPPPPEAYLKGYDLILTSFPHFVSRFKKLGIASEYFKIAFEPRTLDKIDTTQPRSFDISFIGSFTHHHKSGTNILKQLARRFPVNVWGQGSLLLRLFSPIGRHYHGEAWGLDMYAALAQSKIVVNRHINAAEKYANNMRLYESTGMGAMLITDHKKNIGDLFVVGKEIVTYKNNDDLLKKMEYYLHHEKERAQIAKAGQRRTLREHSYGRRMKELVGIVKRHLA